MNTESPHPAAPQPRMYDDLATWWPLVCPPEDFQEEADELLPILLSAVTPRPRTLLELGAGGGSLAWHLKRDLTLTLTDLSPQMLSVSQRINPECEHLAGDMRTLRVDRQFDLVLIHDAIMYCADAESVRAALATAAFHCRPGGAVFILPDFVRETFAPGVEHGGHDATDGRALRYLEWTWDSNPADDWYQVAYAFVLREADGSVRVEQDLHREGCFARDQWLAWLDEAGFDARSFVDGVRRHVFVGQRRGGPDSSRE